MRVAILVLVTAALFAVPAVGDLKQVTVNSQRSLVATVGEGFPDEAWEYPTGLVPTVFASLDYVSGPADVGLLSKGGWRKPIVLKHSSSDVVVHVNCYRRREKRDAVGSNPSTPFTPIVEPDYSYKSIKFHNLQAAHASAEDHDVIAFRHGDILFKVDASDGKASTRRTLAVSVIKAIWKARVEK